jgi:hypothetical protein
MGLGTGYISNPTVDHDGINELGNSDTWGFSSIPAYVIIRTRYLSDKPIWFYLVGKYGWNFPIEMENTKVEGLQPSYYAAGGLGLDVNNVHLEALYQISAVYIRTSSEYKSYTETSDDGTRVARDGILEGGNEYQNHQIILCAGVRI